jgi:nucleotide-binding universal stress UspA family protein
MNQSAIVHWSKPEVILVATDLLEGYTLVLHAIYQARLSNAQVLLVHVVPLSHMRMDPNDGRPFVVSGSEVRNVKAKLDEIAQEFQREGVVCEPVVLSGRPGEQISRFAKARGVARVIVGTRNTDGVARLVEESVAEELIATLDMPVCIIGRRNHPGAACGTPLGCILVAASLEPGSEILVRFGSTLAEVNHSQLVLLHVLDAAGMNEQQLEMAKFAARRKLAYLIPKEAKHRFAPVCHVKEGDPAKIIVSEAGSDSHDLVILGSPHPSIVSWLLGASIVHRVVIESECPVVTVNSLAAADPRDRGFASDIVHKSFSSTVGNEYHDH